MRTFFKNTFRLILALLILAIAGFIFLVAYMMITDYKPDELETLKVEGDVQPSVLKELKGRMAEEGEITFMSWNLGYGGLGREMNFFFDNGRMVRAHEQLSVKYRDAILEQLQSSDSVDFFLLQEIDQSSRRTYYHDQWQQIMNGMDVYSGAYAVNYDVRFVPVPIYKPYGRVKAGMATLSSILPDLAERHAFKGNYSWPKSLFMLDRCFIRTDYDLGNGKKLVVINTHNSAYDDGSLKYEQLKILRDVMISEYEKGHYVVAGGDWNMTPPGYRSFNIKTGDRGIDDKPVIEEGYMPDGWTWAYHSKVPTNRNLSGSYIKGRTGVSVIDYFVLSPNVEKIVVKTANIGFENSDHNPVVMKVRFK